jgi:hypothetical protein
LITKVATEVMFAASDRPTRNGGRLRVPTAKMLMEAVLRRFHQVRPTIATT